MSNIEKLQKLLDTYVEVTKEQEVSIPSTYYDYITINANGFTYKIKAISFHSKHNVGRLLEDDILTLEISGAYVEKIS